MLHAVYLGYTTVYNYWGKPKLCMCPVHAFINTCAIQCVCGPGEGATVTIFTSAPDLSFVVALIITS